MWTSTSLVQSYLKSVQLPNFESYPDGCDRLKSILVKHQQTTNSDLLPQHVVDAAYNFHQHTKSCFNKSSEKKRKNASGSRSQEETACAEDECRYRYPRRKKSHTTIDAASDRPIKWYSWNGTCELRHVLEINVKRHEYDAFMNESVPAVSKSNIGCNTNGAGLMPGPVMGYVFKYQMKDTQEDDTESYERISTTMRKILERRKHESNFSESLRRVLAGSYAHQKTGIVGSAMASYLTRHKSRFRSSHSTAWCPLRDIYKLISGGTVATGISITSGSTYFVCSALHYLCRPRCLESCTPAEFYSKYEVVQATKFNRNDLMFFNNNAKFKHPSFVERTGRFRQGIREREKILIAKTFERDFPDSANFGGDILSPRTLITEDAERYARQVLLLFWHYRTHDDLLVNGKYTDKLREITQHNKLSRQAQTFLQNLENHAYNTWRIKTTKDDLQRCTVLQARHEFEADLYPDEDDNDEEQESSLEYSEIEQLLEQIDAAASRTTNVDGGIPDSVDPAPIKNLGTHCSGYECLSQLTINEDLRHDFISNAEDIPSSNTNANTDEAFNHGTIPTCKDVAYLLMTKTARRTRKFAEISRTKKPVSVLQANGSSKSIVDWANKSGMDKYQRRAFEIFVATFVLTYHKDDASALPGQQRSNLRKETLRLRQLSDVTRQRRANKKQLISMLHGPGGSGKSACIGLLTAYAKEYIENFETDYKFTPQTIVITALTGVAASILQGETVHSRLYLNRNNITHEQIELWEETRMVIIDEISFADRKTVNKMHRNLCRLKQNRAPFGGVHIIFSGDFRQLEPVNKGSKPLYEDSCDIFEEKINCYLELKGMHRFENDMEFGNILMRIRNGDIRKEDIDIINSRVFEDADSLPDDLRYATYYNKDRDAINAALFEKRCTLANSLRNDSANSVLIFCDDIKMRTDKRKYSKLKNRHHFWNYCSESHIHPTKNQPRMDPVLKVYQGCPVMLPANINVLASQANGTRAFFEKVVLKDGELSKTIMYGGVPVEAVTAAQIKYIVLRHENKNVDSPYFRLKPKDFTFNADIMLPEALRMEGNEREIVRMQARQVPILVNNATTGHKLQGATIDNIFVHAWRYEKNWPYVVLSRVTTLKGLFLRQKLKYDPSKFAVPAGLRRMLRKFEMNRPTYWNTEEYETMFFGDGEPTASS